MRRLIAIAGNWNSSLAAAVLWLLCQSAGVAWSNTITVMKDGSGDYTLLQPAADAAAAGDTLLIGPGRYEEVTDFAFNSGVPRDAHLVVRVDNLTIMGMDRDSVIIGPSVPATAQGDPVGLVVAENVGTTHIEKLTFENTWVGAYTLGDFYIEDCVAQYCMEGVTAEGPVTIDKCFVSTNDNGVGVVYTSSAAQITHCDFVDNKSGISFNSHEEAHVSGLPFCRWKGRHLVRQLSRSCGELHN